MAFPDDPLDPANSDIDKCRINVGDTDPNALELSNDLYQYFLDINDNNIGLASIEALKAIVAQYARGMLEVVGDEEASWQQRYEGYKDLLMMYTKDPSYSLLGTLSVYAGGLSKTERITDALNPDLRVNEFVAGRANGNPRNTGFL